MSAVLKPVERLDTWLLGSSERLTRGDPPWLTRERRRARARLGREPVPGPRDEGWRYSNPRSLLEQRLYPAVPAALDEAALGQRLIAGLDAWRVVLVNGRFDPDLSRLQGLPAGARAGGLRQLLSERPEQVQALLNRVAGDGAHLFAALNTAGLDDGFVLELGPEVILERPLELVHVTLGAESPQLIQPRNLIHLEAGARATLIERHLGADDTLYCNNCMLEIELEPRSCLDHHRLQEEGGNAFHLSGLYLRQGRSSSYRGSNLALGGAWSRTDIEIRFAAPGAACDIVGLYLAGDGQLVDFHLDIDHQVPECSSREHFKGLLAGRGRAVLDGRIRVAPQAQKSEAHLRNANLLLSRHAEVDTKPQLEIHADDVQCSHGASVGQIDPDTLFYLRARGIPEAEARRMLCIGFAGEIVRNCGPAALRTYIEERVGARLTAASGGG